MLKVKVQYLYYRSFWRYRLGTMDQPEKIVKNTQNLIIVKRYNKTQVRKEWVCDYKKLFKDCLHEFRNSL